MREKEVVERAREEELLGGEWRHAARDLNVENSGPNLALYERRVSVSIHACIIDSTQRHQTMNA